MVGVSGMAPMNPFLSDSVWPVAHHDSYAQASSNVRGPAFSATGRVDTLFEPAVKGVMSLYWAASNSSGVAWGSGLLSVFKVNTNTLELIDAVEKPHDLIDADMFRGIYSVVSSDGVFYTSIGNIILALTDEIPGNYSSLIKPMGKFVLDEARLEPGVVNNRQEPEGIISLNMLYSGHLAFLTNYGKVN